jgi:O-antigen/teichoic acid export membrane protein
MWTTHSLAVAMFWWMLGSLVVLLFVDLPITMHSEGWRIADVANLGEMGTTLASAAYWNSVVVPLMRQGTVVGSASFLLSLNAEIPRYAIAIFLNERLLGIYAALNYLNAAALMVVMAIGQCVSPRLASLHVAGQRHEFRRLVLKLLLGVWALVLVATAGVYLSGQQLVTVLYGIEYAEHFWLLVALIATSALTYTQIALQVTATACRGIERLPSLSALTVAIHGLCSCLLIPQHGLMGAVAAQAIATACFAFTFLMILSPVIRCAPANSRVPPLPLHRGSSSL